MKSITNLYYIVIAAVASYLAWDIWYYLPLRTKRARTYRVEKEVL